MEISEVRVKLVNNPNERLKAFCSITFENDFVIRDLKVIDGANGTFVAMPSRKLAERCHGCGHKNHLRARFCNECGKKLSDHSKGRRTKLHADIAHPINAACRERIQSLVVEAYSEEVERSKQPGYRPLDMDLDLDDFQEEPPREAATTPAPAQRSSEPEVESGYDELIADLKRDAAHRRETRVTGRVGGEPESATDESEDEVDTEEQGEADHSEVESGDSKWPEEAPEPAVESKDESEDEVDTEEQGEADHSEVESGDSKLPQAPEPAVESNRAKPSAFGEGIL